MIASSAAMRFLMDDVREFHEAMQCAPDPVGPLTDPPAHVVRLRAKLITEEFMETMHAMIPNGDTKTQLKANIDQMRHQIDHAPVEFDLEACADGLADMIYVIVGTATALGIPLDRVWSEVQRANLAKVGGPKREDGKCLKPAGWVPPRIREAIFGEAT